MGSFLVNLHVRTGDHQSLVHELQTMHLTGCYVTAARRGWTSLYEERASTQDDRWIRELGGDVSRRLQAPAIAFLVHDSDFVCYWLFDKGKLLDEFNSCPDYFEEDTGNAAARPDALRSHASTLLPYCAGGVELRDVQAVLEQEPGFAEEQLQALARLLGIDPERVMVDYRDFGREAEPDQLRAVFLGGDKPKQDPLSQRQRPLLFLRDKEESDDDDPEPRRSSPGLLRRGIEGLFGGLLAAKPVDSRVAELVQAAADGDIAAVRRLIAAGTDVNQMAPLKFGAKQQPSAIARWFGGASPAFAVSPLFAAVGNKQLDAARALIELGADVHTVHPIFGSAVHAAAGTGSPELLQLLLDSGADVNRRNAQNQTPLGSLKVLRQLVSHALRLPSLGSALRGISPSDIERNLPTRGWDECERLLLASGAQG